MRGWSINGHKPTIDAEEIGNSYRNKSQKKFGQNQAIRWQEQKQDKGMHKRRFLAHMRVATIYSHNPGSLGLQLP